MDKLTPEQALANLYTASRIAPISADQHDLCKQSAQVLQKAIAKSDGLKAE